MNLINRAVEIAIEVHKNQNDKNGEPYILHVLDVMMRGRNEVEKICGVLHDVVEDSEWTFEELELEGFSKEIIDVIKCLTKESEDEDYDHFIERIMQNRTAISVKLNDLRSNMDTKRYIELSEKDIPRFNKYLKAYKRLIEKQNSLAD